jgi:hypothetical protein
MSSGENSEYQVPGFSGASKSTEAVATRACPKCGVPAGEPCSTRNGVGEPMKIVAVTHIARFAASDSDA